MASSQTLALVRATAVAVENRLALLRLTGSMPYRLPWAASACPLVELAS